MTNDLRRRIQEHRGKSVQGFTARYKVDRLVFFEEFATPLEAIEAEKRIKGWGRPKKIQLIESINPTWRDLSLEWTAAPRGGGVTPR